MKRYLIIYYYHNITFTKVLCC